MENGKCKMENGEVEGRVSRGEISGQEEEKLDELIAGRQLMVLLIQYSGRRLALAMAAMKISASLTK